MKRHLLIGSFALLMLTARPPVAQAQDSVMVKKPMPQRETMPKRQGRGTAQPMPNPSYRTRQPRPNMDKAPIQRDSSKGTTRRDTVK